MTRLLKISSQAQTIAPTAGGVPSSPSPALSSNSRDSSTREDTGTAGDLPANAVPVQIYDGFVEPKSDVWRRV